MLVMPQKNIKTLLTLQTNMSKKKAKNMSKKKATN